MDAQSDVLTKTFATIRSAFDARADAITSLEVELADVKEKAAKGQAQMAQLQSHLEACNTKISNLKQQVGKLQSDLDQSVAATATAKQRASASEAELERRDDLVRTLRETISRHRSDSTTQQDSVRSALRRLLLALLSKRENTAERSVLESELRRFFESNANVVDIVGKVQAWASDHKLRLAPRDTPIPEDRGNSEVTDSGASGRKRKRPHSPAPADSLRRETEKVGEGQQGNKSPATLSHGDDESQQWYEAAMSQAHGQAIPPGDAERHPPFKKPVSSTAVADAPQSGTLTGPEEAQKSAGAPIVDRRGRIAFLRCSVADRQYSHQEMAAHILEKVRPKCPALEEVLVRRLARHVDALLVFPSAGAAEAAVFQYECGRLRAAVGGRQIKLYRLS